VAAARLLTTAAVSWLKTMTAVRASNVSRVRSVRMALYSAMSASPGIPSPDASIMVTMAMAD
jgi:hypothetical protein